jgi:hypothetical protein
MEPGNPVVKSALKIVAFTNSDPTSGIIALLETALEALDETGQPVTAALVAAAIDAYVKASRLAPLPAPTESLH